MKKILFSLGILSIVLSLSAQNPHKPFSPENYAKDQTIKMKELIGFSDAQEKLVYDLNYKFEQKRQKAIQNRNGDRKSMREQMLNLRDEYDESLKKILNEKQYLKYLEEKENLRKRPPRSDIRKPTQRKED